MRRSSTALVVAIVGMGMLTPAAAQPEQRPERRHLTVAEARASFVCKTRVSFDRGHGTQISYMRSDGTIFLWYPGNSVVLSGKWDIVMRATRTEPPREYADVCFLYGPNTYNPVTGQPGGRWSCTPGDALARRTKDDAVGDVFGLSARTTVPFVLSREPTTIKEIAARIRPARASPDPGCPQGPRKTSSLMLSKP